jgi:Core-2/I-Branching enzyme
MRHAYLVLAHQDAPGVVRLVQSLRHEGARFYVHVDAAGDGRVAEALRQEDDVVLVPRIPVRYKAFSMVEATLVLLRAACADRHDYYTLLSGADYPLVPNDQIVARLADSGKQYLTFWRLEDRPSWQHKVQYYYPTEYVPMRMTQRDLGRRAFWAAFRRGRKVLPKRRHPAGLVPYGGSQWWSLTHDCVVDVLGAVARRPDVVRFYRWTESPDELFFHTLVMNGPYAQQVNGFATYQRWRDEVQPWEPVSLEQEKRRMLPDQLMNLRYIDWSSELTGLREAPAVLDARDAPALADSDCLLARKFDRVRSAALLDHLDRARGTAPSCG